MLSAVESEQLVLTTAIVHVRHCGRDIKRLDVRNSLAI